MQSPILRIILSTAAILAALLVGQRPVAAQTWTNGYAFRRAVTISHTMVPNTDQSNFPLLFFGTYSFLATVANGGAVTNSNGYDIIFTSDSAGTNPLAFERQSYNPLTGAMCFWVKIPTLSHSTDTTIYLFYFNSAITADQSNRAAVWDSNYVGVWHMDDSAAATTVADSTSNANNGTAAANTSSKSVTGKIGSALGFNGSTDKVTTSLTRTSASTWEAWFYQTAANSYQSIITIDGANYELMDLNNSSGSFWTVDGLGGTTLSVTGLSQNTWNHLVFVRSGDSSSTGYSAYLNGVLKGQASSGSLSSGNKITFGYRPDDSQPFNGNLDEIRVSNIARSSDWISSEYSNQNSPSTFYSVGNPDINGLNGSTGPYIAAIWPTSGPVTTPVTILGANFNSTQGSSEVAFSGVTGPTTAWTNSSILMPVPMTASNGNVVVSVVGRASNAATFTVTTAPGITNISPISGMVGVAVTISGVNFGASQGSSTVSLNGLNCSVLAWGTSAVSVLVPTGAASGPFTVNVGGQIGLSPIFAVTPVPTGWSDGDVGPGGAVGSASYSGGTFTVNSAGNGVGGGNGNNANVDGFHFVYQPLSGDGTIVARVTSLSTGWDAQGGVMIRETLSQGALNEFLTVQALSTDYIYQWDRATLGTAEANPTSASNQSLPIWLKLVRSGSSFATYTSPDGINWTQFGSSVTIVMAQNVYIGIATSGGNNGANLAQAKFDNVSVSTTSVPGPIITGISATTGTVGSQVILTGSGFGTTQGFNFLTLNGTAVTASVWSDASITFTVPSGATSGHIVVTVAPTMNVSNPVEFTITSNPLPGGWLDWDVGPAGAAGTATYANRVFTLNSAGTGVGGVNGGNNIIDGVHFVYQPFPANGEIVARLKTLQGGWAAQSGLMIRETLAEGATNVFFAATAISSPTFYLNYRTSTGTSETYSTTSSTALPIWMKLTRSGSTFSAYTSPDGINWTQFGSNIALTMAQNAYIGLACSGGNNGTNVASSTFDYVSLTTTSQPAPVIGSLSATTGGIGSQVTLSGSGFGSTQGNSSVTLNGVTATINSWSDSSITITIPVAATTGYLAVTVAPSMNTSNALPFEVTTNPLPSPWLDQDIGAVGLTGGSTYSTNGTFTVQGAGNGVTGAGTQDSFHFVYQPMTGDGMIIARIVSVTGTRSQAGVMFRQLIEDISPLNAFAYYFPQNTDIYFSDRTSEGTSEGSLAFTAAVSLPYWVKLVRSGNTFSAYTSASGANWIQLGTSQTIALTQSAYVGLAVGQGYAASLSTATFDNVSVSSTQNPGPMITSVSSTTGSVGSQVVISGTGFGESQGNSLVVLNDAATSINSWSTNSISITIPSGATSGPLVVSVAPTMNDSNAVQFTVTSNPLPSGWLDQDVGTVGVAGNAAYSNGTFTINGGGYGIGGTGFGYGGSQDAFHFVYQPLSGNGTIIARIVTNPGTAGQAGIMIRQGLDTGALNFLVGNFPQDSGAFVFERTSTGSGETSPAYTGYALPYWVKLVRSGGTFTCFTSPDGTNWTQLGTNLSIPMSQNVYVGLGVSGGSTSSLGSATFDNVSVSFSGWGTSPTITSVTPISGAFGASVTIAGSNFGATQGTSTLTFNGTPATPCGTCWSANSITVTVPNTAMTGNVIVNVGGVNSNGVTFGVFNPSISGISPPAAQGAAIVTLNGSGFGSTRNGNQVLFNGVVGFIQSWSDTNISVQVPANATSGPVTVVEGGVASNSVSFAVETLSVTGISPAMATPGSVVTITGTGFGASQTNSTVSFNGTLASVQSWSDTQIAAIVPAGTTTGPAVVTVGTLPWYGGQFIIETITRVTDSQSHQSTYTSAMIGGAWVPVLVQGSGCSTCTVRGNISYTYDSSGNPLSRTDENGNTTTYTYDSNNNVLTVTVPIGPGHTATTTYTYDGLGDVLTATDPLGNITTKNFDSAGNLLSVATPAPGNGASASVTKFGYNALGELIQIIDPLGNQTNITYFPTGWIQTITDAQTSVTTYAYDSRGNRTSVTDANSKQTTFTYDAMNRLTKITYPDTTTTQFGYDIRGRRTSVTDQNSKQTTYAYDDADRLTSVTDAATNVTTYGYDTESNLTSIKDANQNTTTFDYDAFGRVTETHFPSGQVEQYAYDNIGNLNGKTDRKNQQITYTYDQLNRLTLKTYPDTTTVNYTYDNDSRLTQVSDPTGTYQFTFDNMGRLTGTSTSYAFLTGRNLSTSYGYDAASNRTSFTDPESGSTAYVYDTLNRLQTLAPPAAISGGNFGFGYDALSRRTSLTRPNTVNTSYSYDNLSRLLSVTHAKGGVTLDGATYTVDNAGNRNSKADLYAGVTTNYGYDNIYELLSATQASTTKESYTYDPVGNRLSNLSGSGWSNNTSNELTSRPGVTYTYDNNGNTLTKADSTGTTNYSWDFENRLTSVTLPGSGGTVSFKYDPFGRRIYKSSSSGTSVFAYDGDNLVEETNSSGVAVARYSQTQNIDEPLAMLRSGATSYYHADGLGSVTSLSNTAGALAQTYTFDSFGKRTASSGSLTNPFQYTGRESDAETGLYYYRARYYDPTVGRFMSEDPTGFKGGLNFYPYVTNDPANQTDPMGFDSNSQRCRMLRQKIEDIGESIRKRQRDLQDDPLGLPGSCPGDKANPGLSRRGHQMLINMDKARLAAYTAEYAWLCKDWPPIPPIPVPVLTPQQQRQLATNTAVTVVVGVAVVVVVIALSPVGL